MLLMVKLYFRSPFDSEMENASNINSALSSNFSLNLNITFSEVTADILYFVYHASSRKLSIQKSANS
eukprot:UN00898